MISLSIDYTSFSINVRKRSPEGGKLKIYYFLYMCVHAEEVPSNWCSYNLLHTKMFLYYLLALSIVKKKTREKQTLPVQEMAEKHSN